MGFCSKFLPGAIYNFLVGIPQKKAVEIYLIVFYILFILLLSYLSEQFILAFPNNRRECWFLALLFLTGPFTFSIYVKELGMLDFFWIFAFLLSLLFLQKDYFIYLIPLFSALMILTNYFAIVTYVGALLLIVLFRFTEVKSKSNRITILCVFGISSLISIGLALYLLLNEHNNTVYPIETFDKILIERNANPWYYDFSLYWKDEKNYNTDLYPFMQYFNNIQMISPDARGIQWVFEAFLFRVKVTAALRGSNKTLLIYVLSIACRLPFIGIFFRYIRQTKLAFKKILATGMVLLPFLIEFAGYVCSSDISRWACHSVTIFFFFTFYLLFFEYREGMILLQNTISKISPLLIIILLYFYSSLSIEPYVLLN